MYYRVQNEVLNIDYTSYNTININVIICSNCNIHEGIEIGQVHRADRKGCPTVIKYRLVLILL